MLNLLKEKSEKGEKYTHILNVKVGKQVNNRIGTRFRQFVHSKLNGVEWPQTVTVGNEVIETKISWHSNKIQSSAYYYTKTLVTTDVSVVQATRQTLIDIINDFDESMMKVEKILWDDMGLAYIVTKPCSMSVPISISSGFLSKSDVKKKKKKKEKKKVKRTISDYFQKKN